MFSYAESALRLFPFKKQRSCFLLQEMVLTAQSVAADARVVLRDGSKYLPPAGGK